MLMNDVNEWSCFVQGGKEFPLRAHFGLPSVDAGKYAMFIFH